MVGSVILFSIACIIVPKASRMVTNKIYKAGVKKRIKDDNDDWGPEIVKKSEIKNTNEED
jgi:hypothetical protein